MRRYQNISVIPRQCIQRPHRKFGWVINQKTIKCILTWCNSCIKFPLLIITGGMAVPQGSILPMRTQTSLLVEDVSRTQDRYRVQEDWILWQDFQKQRNYCARQCFCPSSSHTSSQVQRKPKYSKAITGHTTS